VKTLLYWALNAAELFITAADRKSVSGPSVKELHAKIGPLAMENDFFRRHARSYRRCERQAMIDRRHRLPVVQQCRVSGSEPSTK
jgi:putative transposase